ncbi:MAG: hypothetical protein IH853_06570 [Bacteroidetes bacterium]|nr:hypothetical protein [Bacteroidota bacterium]MCH8245109.1 hypothetical protein [Bacteroidota bacterium]
MVGKKLFHHTMTAELGRGGMGMVYKATGTKLNRDVGLKVLPAAALASVEDRARFNREGQAAAQLHHPNTATVLGIEEAIPADEDGHEIGGLDGSRPFIAMEYTDGESSMTRQKKGPLPVTEPVNIAAMNQDPVLQVTIQRNVKEFISLYPGPRIMNGITRKRLHATV